MPPLEEVKTTKERKSCRSLLATNRRKYLWSVSDLPLPSVSAVSCQQRRAPARGRGRCRVVYVPAAKRGNILGEGKRAPFAQTELLPGDRDGLADQLLILLGVKGVKPVQYGTRERGMIFTSLAFTKGDFFCC